MDKYIGMMWKWCGKIGLAGGLAIALYFKIENEKKTEALKKAGNTIAWKILEGLDK